MDCCAARLRALRLSCGRQGLGCLFVSKMYAMALERMELPESGAKSSNYAKELHQKSAFRRIIAPIQCIACISLAELPAFGAAHCPGAA